MIRLARDLQSGRVYDHVQFLFAEGYGDIPEAMGQRAALRWYQAGQPATRLFIASGKKICFPNDSQTIQVFSNTDLETITLPYTQEAGVLLDSLCANGIPPEQCLYINNDDNTQDQAIMLRRDILENEAVCQLSCDWTEIPIVGVTHARHERRCAGTFRKYGYNLLAMLTVPFHGDLRQPITLPHMRHEWIYRIMEPVRIQQYRKKGWM